MTSAGAGASSSQAVPTTRRLLDRMFDAAAYLAAFFMVGTLAMVLLAIVGRFLNWFVPGTDAYAGYCMAASGFLALAHTLKRGEHIRVTLFLERFHGRLKRPLEIWCHLAGSFFCAALAWYSVRLVWQSRAFNDVSQGNDATPLWIPQIAMAAGAIVLFVAMVDDLVLVLRRRELRGDSGELKAIE